MLTENKHNKYTWWIILVFGLLYCNISFINHYLFRTTAWDMGIFNHAIYDYAHFRFNYCTSCIPLAPTITNLLAGHFELYLIIFSPFYYIFGSYTLLIFQVASILFGGFGVYKFIRYKTNNNFFSRIALVHFFCLWGVFTALSFDYHNNVVAAMLVPWFLYYFDKEKFAKAALIFFFIIIGKENMPLWMGFIGLALALWHYKNKQKRIAGTLFALAGFISLILILKVIIPAFSETGEGYTDKSYQVFGSTAGEIMETIFTRPGYVISILFTNQYPDKPEADYFKLATYIAVLLSGGWAFVCKPKYLFMLVPVFAQKILSSNELRWGVLYHYSIEFAPVISIALFSTLYKLFATNQKRMYGVAVFSVILSAATSFHIIESTFANYHQSALHRFYSKGHYSQGFNIREAQKALKLVPENASVSAQSVLVPHLAFRDTIYLFPAAKNETDYLVVLEVNAPFGIGKNDFDTLRTFYNNDPAREIIYDKNAMLIIRKKSFENQVNANED